MFKKILIPTDGSSLSEIAITGAIDYAKSGGAKLVGLTVSEKMPPLMYGEVWSGVAPINFEENIKIYKKQLAAVGQKFEAAGISHEIVFVEDEHPWKAILDTAKERGCDAIFMASHGRRGVDAVLLGSETNKVLTHSTIPVLVYR